MRTVPSILTIIAAVSMQLSNDTDCPTCSIRENCITHKMFDGSAASFDDDPRTCTQLPFGDMVTHRLEVKSHCVRSQEMKCPVKNTSAETHDLDLVYGLFPTSPNWCDLRVAQGDDHCHPNPCNSGTCVTGAHGYTCQCDVGFNGTHCENDCQYYLYAAESAGVANRCVSVNNGGNPWALAIYHDLTWEQCRRKACVCDGCSNGLTRANSFNYDSRYCILRHCQKDLSIGTSGNPKEVWVMTGFP